MPSLPSAKISRDAPTTHASAQLKAETIAPSVMMLPIHDETYIEPRLPISDGEAMNA